MLGSMRGTSSVRMAWCQTERSRCSDSHSCNGMVRSGWEEPSERVDKAGDSNGPEELVSWKESLRFRSMEMKCESLAMMWINASCKPRIVVVGPLNGYLHSYKSNLD